ncbi:MAG: hypothetical protein LiPW39_402 [Parcubacteria group bacterium LiPW_39]|nr:MAG: hypothetical protein LiPW39_402 [Parcubacteria group bacterium LiPW_39]
MYYSKSQGLKPLIFCVKNYRKQMCDATIFDKVVGRAAALLLVYAGVRKILTPLISRNALLVLQRGGAETEYKKIVRQILNAQGSDLCPMEKMSRGKNIEEFCLLVGIEE